MARRALLGGACAFTLAAALMTAGAASAGEVPGIDVRTWAPSVDPNANLVTEPTATPGPWVLSAGSYLHYEHETVALRALGSNSVTATPVDNQLGLDLLLALGLGHFAEIGVRMPVLLDEQGSSALPSAVDSDSAVPRASMGDLALVGKGTILESRTRGFGLATVGEVSFPTGAQTSFMSDTGVDVTLRVLAEYATRPVSVTASAGYTLRTSHVEWPESPSGVTFGDTIPWTIGVVLHPGAIRAIDPWRRQSIEVALHGWLPAGPTGPFGLGDPGSAEESPVLVAVSDKVGLGHYRDAFVVAGVDVGLDQAIGVPAVRVALGFGMRFVSHDQDHDGIDDDRDACPDLPEDFDGYEDADGCPEVDNDQDGIVDGEDACPLVPGVPSPDPRKNGCPADMFSPERPPEALPHAP
jgi:OmpA-OmpF porin, OOP family